MDTMIRPPIRTMQPVDLLQVMSIEELNGHGSNPATGRWDEADFRQVLMVPKHQGIVALEGERIIGFAIYCLMDDKIHICNMAVRPRYARNGVGTEMINKLVARAKKKNRNLLEIDIRESNLGAQIFLRNMGFKAIHVVRGWYETSVLNESIREDAYKFQLILEA